MRFPAFLAALATSASFVSARADVLVVQGSAPQRPAPWSATVSIPRFPDSTGVLTDVRIVMRVNTIGSAGFENRSAVVAQATANVTGTVTATFPAPNPSCSASTTVPVSVSAPPFDGVNDFGGTSDGILTNLPGTNTGSVAATDIGQFLGAGTLSVSASALNQSTVNALPNFGMRPGLVVGAEIEVTYVYTPHPDCDGDGIPDSLEPDADSDGLPDDCDVDPAPAPELGGSRPGSLLVFPEFDHRPAEVTMLTLTNTAPDGTVPTEVQVVYVSSACTTTDLVLTMPPRDTVTFLSNYNNSPNLRGYAYAFARNPANDSKWSYDHLVGSALRMTVVDAYTHGYSAISFQSPVVPFELTDLDADGVADLDGLEYVQAPEKLLIPRFLGSTSQRSNDLILINLTGGTAFQAVANFLIYNDNMEVFSAQTSLGCWSRTSLESISSATTHNFLVQTNHAVDEVLGAPFIEAGWIEIDGGIAF